MDFYDNEVSCADNKFAWGCINGHDGAVDYWYEQGASVDFLCKVPSNLSHAHRGINSTIAYRH